MVRPRWSPVGGAVAVLAGALAAALLAVPEGASSAAQEGGRRAPVAPLPDGAQALPRGWGCRRAASRARLRLRGGAAAEPRGGAAREVCGGEAMVFADPEAAAAAWSGTGARGPGIGAGREWVPGAAPRRKRNVASLESSSAAEREEGAGEEVEESEEIRVVHGATEEIAFGQGLRAYRERLRLQRPDRCNALPCSFRGPARALSPSLHASLYR